MSRTAVVLAADSATTVTSWKNGELEKRYFKGANKLYELSRQAPVGLMIFGSAGLGSCGLIASITSSLS